MLAWVFFRAPTIADAADFVVDMFSPSNAGLHPGVATAATMPAVIALLIGLLSFLLPAHFTGGRWLAETVTNRDSSAQVKPISTGLVYVVIALPLSMALIATNDFSPFLYFQF